MEIARLRRSSFDVEMNGATPVVKTPTPCCQPMTANTTKEGANKKASPDQKEAPTYNQRQLKNARKLLADTLNEESEIDLFGFILRRNTRHAHVWTVYDPDHDALVDYINVEATMSAVTLCEHINMLREEVESQPGDKTVQDGGDDRSEKEPNWEQIARKEKAIDIETRYDDIVSPTASDLSEAVAEREGERKTYLLLVSGILEYVSVIGRDLEEIGVLDRSTGDDYVLFQIIDAASYVISGNREYARQRLKYALSALNALEEDADDR